MMPLTSVCVFLALMTRQSSSPVSGNHNFLTFTFAFSLNSLYITKQKLMVYHKAATSSQMNNR